MPTVLSFLSCVQIWDPILIQKLLFSCNLNPGNWRVLGAPHPCFPTWHAWLWASQIKVHPSSWPPILAGVTTTDHPQRRSAGAPGFGVRGPKLRQSGAGHFWCHLFGTPTLPEGV